jgi:hypothetical protein
MVGRQADPAAGVGFLHLHGRKRSFDEHRSSD